MTTPKPTHPARPVESALFGLLCADCGEPTYTHPTRLALRTRAFRTRHHDTIARTAWGVGLLVGLWLTVFGVAAALMFAPKTAGVALLVVALVVSVIAAGWHIGDDVRTMVGSARARITK